MIAAGERDDSGYSCIRLLHKYYFGEESDYSGSISCPADCTRYAADIHRSHSHMYLDYLGHYKKPWLIDWLIRS